ncbi:MAG: VWA domain-containing protein [Cyclobacteriaceae bacterium]|nr:hypothetical protein [Cyclobacteriaceae bacterium]MCH8517528.1 VWA domain-containing protein [Cyclobacteriaceae bacterium]
MKGHQFVEYIPPKKSQNKSGFDNLFPVFQELITITGGNVSEALNWLTNLDKQYNLTGDSDYGIGDFFEDLKRKGYITEEQGPEGGFKISAKTERKIRQSALEEIFGKLKKSKGGNHNTPFPGRGDEPASHSREYRFGDEPNQILMTESIRNAHINHGMEDFMMTENDLEVREADFKTNTSTVLMIDISHSMILYGEDRITPAKKVAMALAELITRKYPKDTLDVIVFGNDAWQIEIKDLPYLQVGPYHTNTIAGLELAMDILRKRKTTNKQIFMITDGKPTCMKKGLKYYKNSFGLDPKIINKTMTLADKCRKLKIPVTTFMIASDPYLQDFVRDFTKVNSGKAYFSSLKGLGHLVFEDFAKNKKRNLK